MFILTDEKTADEDIIRINEKYYGISFPDCYKNVLKTLGEGHIGYLLMYSMDPNGKHNIRNFISKNMINSMKMFPVIDMENGDYIGFDIINNECTDNVVFWSHDNMNKRDLRISFYNLIINVAFENRNRIKLLEL